MQWTKNLNEETKFDLKQRAVVNYASIWVHLADLLIVSASRPLCSPVKELEEILAVHHAH